MTEAADYADAVAKSRRGFGNRLRGLLRGGAITDETWEEVEETLIRKLLYLSQAETSPMPSQPSSPNCSRSTRHATRRPGRASRRRACLP
jgi:hypothetical protein